MRSSIRRQLMIILAFFLLGGLGYGTYYTATSVSLNTSLWRWIAPSLFSDATQKSPQKTPRLAIFVKKGYLGEEEFAAKLLIGARRLGWDAYVYKVPKYRKNPLKEWAARSFTRILETVLRPTFTLTLDHTIPRRSGRTSYTFITLEDAFVEDGRHPGDAVPLPRLTKAGKNLLRYDGFINGDASHGNIGPLMTLCSSTMLCPGVVTYGMPTSYGPLFDPDPQLLASAKLLYAGANWDASRTTQEFQTLFKILENEGDLVVYGQVDKWPFLGPAFKGFLPFDGVSFLEALHGAGIALCFHSQGHIRSAIPSARVFETIAAGAMPIVDQHPFIQQVFGDTVLYVDTGLPPVELARDIKAHQRWVQTHPDLAAAMITRAQAIFAETYSIEALLMRLNTLHQTPPS